MAFSMEPQETKLSSPMLPILPYAAGESPCRAERFADTEISSSGSSLISLLLKQQQDLTAVERFSRDHDQGERPHHASHYRELIPLTQPGPGEQYAFEVDLDSCTGCKACVTGCHSLNGLDDTETWRDVGLLLGGTTDNPWLQTVTTACHHCVEPACMLGCPVKAYEKDPLTGIVRHLDDQCIGCQYCVLKCPYDVPKFNADRGIVRKCDMCSQRLAREEAPACVQACPNSAIQIRIANTADLVKSSHAKAILPGAPASDYTIPSTIYKSQKPFPRNVLPADFYEVRPEHNHPPLVWMLVLTQMSVGAYAAEYAVRLSFHPLGGTSVSLIQASIALMIGISALVASTLHLGRPLYAYRAILGLGHSWLSREILLFGAFAKLAMLEALLLGMRAIGWKVPGWIIDWTSQGVVVSGIAGVFCSIMIYHDTRRDLWRFPSTASKFLLTATVLGSATVLTTHQFVAYFGLRMSKSFVESQTVLLRILIVASVAKLVLDALPLLHRWDRTVSPMKRTATLLTRNFASTAVLRFACGLMGGVALPAWLLANTTNAGPGNTLVVAAVMVASLAQVLTGELAERKLFFTTVVAPKMPGGLRP